MRIVFLDIDGVLVRMAPRAQAVLPQAVAHLNTLTDATQAQLVLTSTWRTLVPFEFVARGLVQAGVRGSIIGATPVIEDAERGDEIAEWLRTHASTGAFVILDDDNDMGTLLPRLVQTDPALGLQEKDVQRALQLLAERPDQ